MEKTLEQARSVNFAVSGAVFPGTECSLDGNLESFKDTLVSIAKLVSYDVTKISILFSGPPYPDEATIIALATPMISRLKILQVTFQQIPRISGRTLQRKIKAAVQKIMDSALSFLNLVKTFHESPREGGMELLRTSQIWESCDQIANIPLLPTECVREEIGKQTALVNDALEELTEAMTDEPSVGSGSSDEEEEGYHGSYSPRNLEILPYCTALVKAAAGLLKKISLAVKRSGKNSKVEEVDQLDSVVDACLELSPCVDEFVMAVEPPLEMAQVKEEAINLTKKQREILELVQRCHFITEEDQNWITILSKALDHNLRKIEENPGVA